MHARETEEVAVRFPINVQSISPPLYLILRPIWPHKCEASEHLPKILGHTISSLWFWRAKTKSQQPHSPPACSTLLVIIPSRPGASYLEPVDAICWPALQANALKGQICALDGDLKIAQDTAVSTKKEAVRESEEKMRLEMKEQQLSYQRRIQVMQINFTSTSSGEPNQHLA